MDITVTTSIGIPDIIPPRCRSPRYAEVLLRVLCRIAECARDQVQLAAQVTQFRSDALETTDLYYAPSLGFLEPTAIAPEAIASSLAPAPLLRAFSPDQIPGQGQKPLDTARVKIQREADQYVLIDAEVYRRTPEPCYFVHYTPSFHYTTLELEVCPVPEYSEERLGSRDPFDALHGHFFNACQRVEADALMAAMQSGEHASLSVDARATIAVRTPEVFTFDSTRWHTEYERAQIAHAITQLLATLRDVRTRDAQFMPLYPERARLVRQVSTALHEVLATFDPPAANHHAPPTQEL
jgi:hypothetical protein